MKTIKNRYRSRAIGQHYSCLCRHGHRIRSQWRWKSVNNTRHPDTYIGWPFDGYRETREEITKVCHYLFYNKPLSFGSCLCRHIDINMVIHHLLINR